ncbi:MAG: hypothetical protein QNJ97_14755 [Myxococcota bacterium]|nr:hypothetical protein [Myxococcota bacterium]
MKSTRRSAIKGLILSALVSLVLLTSNNAFAWATGFKYVQTIQYNYKNGGLDYLRVGFADSYKAGSANYWVYIGQPYGEDLLDYPDVMNLISQLERLRMENQKVYLESYTNRKYGSTPLLLPNDSFRGNY